MAARLAPDGWRVRDRCRGPRRWLLGLGADLMALASRRVAWADGQKNQGSPVAVPPGLANALVIMPTTRCIW